MPSYLWIFAATLRILPIEWWFEQQLSHVGLGAKHMAKKLEDLDKKFWKELKKKAGIKSTGFFKKADAAVGSKIEAVNKARSRFVDIGTTAELLKYRDALQALSDTFDKFCSKKSLDDIDETDVKKTEKEQLVDDIEDWKKEIDDALTNLNKKFKQISTTLEKKGGDKVLESMDAEKRLDFWQKTGVLDF